MYIHHIFMLIFKLIPPNDIINTTGFKLCLYSKMRLGDVPQDEHFYLIEIRQKLILHSSVDC